MPTAREQHAPRRGNCRVEDLVRAGATVGLGVDGAASNEDSNLAMEIHQAVFTAGRKRRCRVAKTPRQRWALERHGPLQRWRRGVPGTRRCGTLASGTAPTWRSSGGRSGPRGMDDPLAALRSPHPRARKQLSSAQGCGQGSRLLTGDEERSRRTSQPRASAAVACGSLNLSSYERPTVHQRPASHKVITVLRGSAGPRAR